MKPTSRLGRENPVGISVGVVSVMIKKLKEGTANETF
jgi:hypothetical protein